MQSVMQRIIGFGITLLLGVSLAAVARSQTGPNPQRGPAVTIRAETLLDGRGGLQKGVVIKIENGHITSGTQSRERVTYDLPGITLMVVFLAGQPDRIFGHYGVCRSDHHILASQKGTGFLGQVIA